MHRYARGERPLFGMSVSPTASGDGVTAPDGPDMCLVDQPQFPSHRVDRTLITLAWGMTRSLLRLGHAFDRGLVPRSRTAFRRFAPADPAARELLVAAESRVVWASVDPGRARVRLCCADRLPVRYHRPSSRRGPRYRQGSRWELPGRRSVDASSDRGRPRQPGRMAASGTAGLSHAPHRPGPSYPVGPRLRWRG